jgi:hypothetical protein
VSTVRVTNTFRTISALYAIAIGVWCAPLPNVTDIVRRSVEANDRDWQAAPRYEYFERDRTKNGTDTWHVTMTAGSPYRELVAVNGKPLSADERKREEQKRSAAVSERTAESTRERNARIAEYEKDRGRDRHLMRELTRAFDFKLLGQRRQAGHSAYLLEAAPRARYHPPDLETEVLAGMRGRLWIDKETYRDKSGGGGRAPGFDRRIHCSCGTGDSVRAGKEPG